MEQLKVLKAIQELTLFNDGEILTIERIAAHQGITEADAKRIAAMLKDKQLISLEGDTVVLTTKGQTTITHL